MKITFNKVCLLSMLMLFLNAGCKKNVQKEEPLIGGDLAIQLLGNLVPSSVTMEKNSIATVSFVGSNIIYKFDLNVIDANSYWGRLIEARNNSTTVKVYVINETKIVRVE